MTAALQENEAVAQETWEQDWDFFNSVFHPLIKKPEHEQSQAEFELYSLGSINVEIANGGTPAVWYNMGWHLLPAARACCIRIDAQDHTRILERLMAIADAVLPANMAMREQLMRSGDQETLDRMAEENEEVMESLGHAWCENEPELFTLLARHIRSNPSVYQVP